MIRGLINHVRHRNDGYDRRGNAIFLSGRLPDPDALQIPGIPASSRDQALELVCKSFEIPLRQMHCLRLDDQLMEIYRSFNGARNWDRLEYVSLRFELAKLPGEPVSRETFIEQLQTVKDIIRFISSRRQSGEE